MSARAACSQDLVLVGKDVIEPEIKGYLWRDFDSDSDR